MLLEAILKHSQRANLTLEAKALEQAFKVLYYIIYIHYEPNLLYTL